MIYYPYFYKRMKVSHLVPYDFLLRVLIDCYRNSNNKVVAEFGYKHSSDSKCTHKQKKMLALVDMFLSKYENKRTELWE